MDSFFNGNGFIAEMVRCVFYWVEALERKFCQARCGNGLWFWFDFYLRFLCFGLFLLEGIGGSLL